MEQLEPKKRIYQKRLASEWTYKKYPWYHDILVAKQRRQELSNRFDTFAALAEINKVYQKQLLVINRELEILEDYFEWLQLS
jgi:hypothetical protein